MIEINKIYFENCLDTMSKLEDNSVDLIITSPPYNMNLRIRKGKYCSRVFKQDFSTKYNTFKDNLPIEEFYELHKSILKEIIRISKLTFYVFQVVTGSKKAFFKLIGDFNEELKEIIVWDKVNSQPAMHTGVLNSQFENILVFGDNPISRQYSNSNFDRGTLSNLWSIKKSKYKTKVNSARFPEELVEKIISNFSQENDIVYDPFCGTGTTPFIAKKMNRNYIASELEQDCYEETLKRLGK